jgi:hypothetical protein
MIILSLIIFFDPLINVGYQSINPSQNNFNILSVLVESFMFEGIWTTLH